MIELLIAIALIIAGVSLLLIKKKAKADLGTASPTTASTNLKGKNDSSAQDSSKKLVEQSANLENLRVPGNFPEEVVFYFGSQTGTAEKFCQVLEEELNKIQGVQSTKVCDFEQFNVEEFQKHKLAIFCVATHYEGDPCDNSKKVYKWLRDQRKIKDEKPLTGMKYTVFGLGDSSYEQFNVIGKFFNEGLEELGGERIYKYGEGNAENNKTEDEFNEWKTQIWTEIIDYYVKQGGSNE